MKEQTPKTSRGAVVVLIPLSFVFFSLLVPPFLPAQVYRHTAATKKEHHPFTFKPLLISCVTLEDKGVEHVRVIVFYIKFVLSIWLLM